MSQDEVVDQYPDLLAEEFTPTARPAVQPRPKGQAKTSEPMPPKPKPEPTPDDFLQPPFRQKLSVMVDIELLEQVEAAVVNLHNAGDFSYAGFADVYRRAFAYFFCGKLKPTEIYRKGAKRRSTLLVNESTAEKLQEINPKVRSRMLEQVLRTFYRVHLVKS